MRLKTGLKQFIRQSSHFHVRQAVATPGDLIELIDRFIDGRMCYALEWDDFISWEQADPDVELARVAIGKHESWLFSQDRSKINAYAYRAAEERNRLAAMMGRPQRGMPVLDTAGETLLRPTDDPGPARVASPGDRADSQVHQDRRFNIASRL